MTVATGTELDVSTFSLDEAEHEVDRLLALLSVDECARAARFRFSQHRDRFVVGRGRLREVLGRRTGQHPGSVQFVYGRHGKPELADSVVRFNLSHCDDLAVLAVSQGCSVGVDLERLRPVADRELVAERFFSGMELQALRALPVPLRDAAFLRCWTRKEAYLKALGGGLSVDLASFAVSLDSADASLLWAEDGSELDRWSVIDLTDHCPGHVAAIVLETREGS